MSLEESFYVNLCIDFLGDMVAVAEEHLSNMAAVAEEHRTNMAAVAEEHRSNIAAVAEEHRSNIAAGDEKHRSNIAAGDEKHRSNIAAGDEEHRSNIAAGDEKHRSNIAAGDEPDWHRHIRCAMGDCGRYYDCDDPAQMVVDRKLDRAMDALRATASLSGCSRKDLEALVAHQLTAQSCLFRETKRVTSKFNDALFAVVKCPYCVAAGDSPANAPVDDCPDDDADYFISTAAYNTCTDLLEGDALAEFEEMWEGHEFADASTGRVIDPDTAWWVYKALGAGPDMRARVVEFLRYLCQAGALGMTICEMGAHGGADQTLYIREPGAPELSDETIDAAVKGELEKTHVLVHCHHPDGKVVKRNAKQAVLYGPYRYSYGSYDIELPSTYDPEESPGSFKGMYHGSHVWVTVPRPGGRWSVFYVRNWDWPKGAVCSTS